MFDQDEKKPESIEFDPRNRNEQVTPSRSGEGGAIGFPDRGIRSPYRFGFLVFHDSQMLRVLYTVLSCSPGSRAWTDLHDPRLSDVHETFFGSDAPVLSI